MSRPRRRPPCPERGNVLLVGGGGREHALAWKLRQSQRLGDLWLTDGLNAGLQRLGKRCPIEIDLGNAFRVQRWCDRHAIHLIVVGPEGPLTPWIATTNNVGKLVIEDMAPCSITGIEISVKFPELDDFTIEHTIPVPVTTTFKRERVTLEWDRRGIIDPIIED